MGELKWVSGGYRSDCTELWLLENEARGVVGGVSFLNDVQLWDRYLRVQEGWVITPEVTSLEEAKAAVMVLHRMGGGDG